MIDSKHENIPSDSSLSLIIRAFDNYESLILRYEKLLMDTIAINTSLKDSIIDVSCKLENLPKTSVLVDTGNSIRKIQYKVNYAILVLTIIGSVGSGTYYLINRDIEGKIDSKLTKQIKTIVNEVNLINQEKPHTSNPIIVDKEGNRVPIIYDKDHKESK